MSDFEVFAAWVSSIDIKIEMLKIELSSDISIQLDYSENSLKLIENYILNNYSSANKLMVSEKGLRFLKKLM